jgi:hypothetical protein
VIRWQRKDEALATAGTDSASETDDEVLQYALSRSLSPALIAEYQTQLPDKKLLQAKLHEFYEQVQPVKEQSASAKVEKGKKKTRE